MDDFIKRALQAQEQKQRQARQRRNQRILAVLLTATAAFLGLACIIALAGAGYYLVRALNKPSPADSMKQKVTAIVQEFGGEVSFEEFETLTGTVVLGKGGKVVKDDVVTTKKWRAIIDLSGTGIGDAGLLRLCECFTEEQLGVLVLKVRDTEITDEGLLALAKVNVNLDESTISLDVSGSKVTDEGVQKLRRSSYKFEIVADSLMPKVPYQPRPLAIAEAPEWQIVAERAAANEPDLRGPDGQVVVGELHRWKPFGGHGVDEVFFSTDGRRLIALNGNAAFVIYDLESKEELARVYSPGERRVVSPDLQRFMTFPVRLKGKTPLLQYVLWNLQTGELLHNSYTDEAGLKQHRERMEKWVSDGPQRIPTDRRDYVDRGVVSPDGRLLAASGYEPGGGMPLKLVWDLESGQLIKKLDAGRPDLGLRSLSSFMEDEQLKEVADEIRKGKDWPQHALPAHPYDIPAWQVCGNVLLEESEQDISIRRLINNEVVSVLPKCIRIGRGLVASTPTGLKMLSGTWLDLRSGRSIYRIKVDIGYGCTALSASGRYAAVGGRETGDVVLIRLPADVSEVPTLESPGHKPYAVEVASLSHGLLGRDCRFLDDNQTLVSRSEEVGAIDLSLFQQAAEGGANGIAEADGTQFQRSIRLDDIPEAQRLRIAPEMINKRPRLKTSWTEYFQDAAGRPVAFSLHWEGDVTTWDLESGMVRSVQTDSTNRLSTSHRFEYSRDRNISVSPDGRAILVGDLHRGFDLRLAMPTKTTDSTLGIAVGSDAIAVRFSGRGRWLAAAYESSIFLWKDPATRKNESSAPDLTIPIPPLARRSGMEFSLDERLLITGHLTGTVRVWDLERNVESKEIRCGAGELVALAPSPDARFLATSVQSANDSRLTIWSLEDGRNVAVLLNDDAPESLAYSPDGRWLASNHGLLKLWMVNEPSVFTPAAPSASPEPSDEKALVVDRDAKRLEAREQSARKALEDAKATDNDRLRAGKLKRVLQSFPGTKAAVEAEQILREGGGNK